MRNGTNVPMHVQLYTYVGRQAMQFACLYAFMYVRLHVYLHIGMQTYICIMYFHAYIIITRYLLMKLRDDIVGRGGSLVDSAPLLRRVEGSNPALAATFGSSIEPI